MKKIVLLTYYWPPDNSSGVQRWVYFAHYLKKLGHTITVVTVDPNHASYKNADDSFAYLTEGIEVKTTGTFELLKLYSKITTGDSNKGIPRGNIDTNQSFVKKVASFIRTHFFIPDARRGWVRYATMAVLGELKKDPDQLLITTGTPHSAHLVGLRVKKKMPSVKWLADFRDPWLELHYSYGYQANWVKRLNAKLERKVLYQADCVLTVGPSLVQLLREKIPEQMALKVSYIHNGYDQVKMESITSQEPDIFTISYVGLLLSEFKYEAFLAALRKVCETHKKMVHLILAGNICDDFIDKAKTIANVTVDYRGFVSHNESMTIMKSSSLLFTLIITQPRDEIIISGKLMEYIAAQKPILCIANKNGDAAKLIAQCNAGKVFHYEEEETMTQFILQCYDQQQNIPANTEMVRQYSREHTAKLLSESIQSI